MSRLNPQPQQPYVKEETSKQVQTSPPLSLHVFSGSPASSRCNPSVSSSSRIRFQDSSGSRKSGSSSTGGSINSASTCLYTLPAGVFSSIPTTANYQIETPQTQMEMKDLSSEDPNTAEFLAWRRLHLSKAKLSGITEMATLMAGFSVVATVELQINDDASPVLLTVFTVTTALLVSTTMMAIMISTCILPYIQVVVKLSATSNPEESPHDKMRWYIDLSWVLANTVSIFLFTLDVILLCWIKLTYFSVVASWCATVIMIPVLLAVCVFGVVFYRNIVQHQYIISHRKYRELEEMKRQLDSTESIIIV